MTTTTKNLKHAGVLLDDIAKGVAKIAETENPRLGTIEVIFTVGGTPIAGGLIAGGEMKWIGSLAAALDTIATDLYWDDSGDFSDVTHAEVRTM